MFMDKLTFASLEIKKKLRSPGNKLFSLDDQKLDNI